MMQPTDEPHPMQPLTRDENGVIRFRKNAIVAHLLDAGPFDLNRLAVMSFNDEDRAQFAQLIGYSVSGWGDLSYVTPEQAGAADEAAERMT